MRAPSRGTKIFVTILAVVLLAIILFPFLVMISTMFRSYGDVYRNPPSWFPEKWLWSNFVDVWAEYDLWDYFDSSFYVAVGTMFLNTLLCVPAAYAIARLRFPGRQGVLYLLLIIQMFSPIIVIIALFKMMAVFRLLDSYLGLILVNTVFTLSFTTWMMFGYLKAIPVSIEEAAQIDGCTRLQSIIRIILPISVPGLVTTMIYTFIFAWNEFLFAFTFIQSKSRMPLTIGLFNFVGRSRIQWQYLCTSAFLAVLPVLILFYFIEKRLVAGLAGGAVKE